jgi:hypothetical protein
MGCGAAPATMADTDDCPKKAYRQVGAEILINSQRPFQAKKHLDQIFYSILFRLK